MIRKLLLALALAAFAGSVCAQQITGTAITLPVAVANGGTGVTTKTGTGSVVLSNSPTLVTPALGVATSTSAAIGGCTIGSNVLCTTGTTSLGGNVVAPASTYAGGTNYATSADRATLDLATQAGFPAAAFAFPATGHFQVAEFSFIGTNDIFFQALPATTAGYGILEAYGSAGLVLYTGNNSNPIIFGVNRVNVAEVTASGVQTIGPVLGALSSCGTGSPSKATTSTDMAGEITEGTTTAGCVIAFSSTKTNAPFCVVSSQTADAAFAYSISTTAITLVNTSSSGHKFDYICIQR